MYSTHSQLVRDAMCFFMNEEEGQEIAYVQFPQHFDNIGKNDLYANAISDTMEVRLISLSVCRYFHLIYISKIICLFLNIHNFSETIFVIIFLPR